MIAQYQFLKEFQGAENRAIQSDPAKYIMVFRTSMLGSDFGGELPPNSRCLFSRWEGYLDQPDWQTTRKKIEAADGDLIHIHTSGHAFVEDLQKLVKEIGPRKTVPMHTFEPEALHEYFDNVVVIEDGQSLEL